VGKWQQQTQAHTECTKVGLCVFQEACKASSAATALHQVQGNVYTQAGRSHSSMTHFPQL
jgi:hypothetical protein